MREEIKELLEENPLVDELREDLCHILEPYERIEYLRDLKEVLNVLIEEEFENHFKSIGKNLED
jgi:hypothetical protein